MGTLAKIFELKIYFQPSKIFDENSPVETKLCIKLEDGLKRAQSCSQCGSTGRKVTNFFQSEYNLGVIVHRKRVVGKNGWVSVVGLKRKQGRDNFDFLKDAKTEERGISRGWNKPYFVVHFHSDLPQEY